MVHPLYLLGIFIAAIFGWSSWIVVISKLSPFLSPMFALSFFYASLFIALTSTLALLGYYIRIWINKNEVYAFHINIALRQGTLISIMICLSLLFQRMRVLTWWDGLLLLMLLVLIELYFMGRNV